MKTQNFVFIMSLLVVFSGCAVGPATYETLVERVLNPSIGKSYIPKNFGIRNRKVYSENRYIYLSEYPKGCIVGYLTNRDDKPEVVQEWIILSGKEYCKETPGVGMWM
ncbi:hypothetical protein LMG7974_01926 [Campylobacter majalis]|uniref:Lipoprotein n=1 Tax=Campylobacter majalis TaxID=2790656 RepID=A0ABN7KCS0_9BACT|nr:hypothetical protein [Campylobacter majalis]CAD7289841.1 hypothetical protein LMG7974_01926 [Campylobacter majalis]